MDELEIIEAYLKQESRVAFGMAIGCCFQFRVT